MKALKAIIIIAMLMITIALMPGHTVAQQPTSEPPTETQGKPVEIVRNNKVCIHKGTHSYIHEE